MEILTGEAGKDDSVGVQLLSDIRTVFEQDRVDSLSTFDLLSSLCDAEPRWLDFSFGKPLSAPALARLLKRFGIVHRKLRVGAMTPWGYQRKSFEDAWARYLPRNLEQVEQSNNVAGEMQFSNLEQSLDVPLAKNEKSPINTSLVPCVPLRSNGGDQLKRCRIHGTETHWWERQPISSADWVCAKCHPQPPSVVELGFDKI